MTGYRAFSKEFVKGFPVLSKGFEIETEMTIHAVDKNFKLVEVPVDYRDRPAGSVSKLNTYSDGFKVLKMIATLFKEYKPFYFFGLFALIFLILACIFGTPIVIEYFKTGLVPRFPTLIVAGNMPNTSWRVKTGMYFTTKYLSNTLSSFGKMCLYSLSSSYLQKTILALLVSSPSFCRFRICSMDSICLFIVVTPFLF